MTLNEQWDTHPPNKALTPDDKKRKGHVVIISLKNFPCKYCDKAWLLANSAGYFVEMDENTPL